MNSTKYLLLLLIFNSCAQIVTPDGGLKDTKPPIIVKCKPIAGALNYSEEKIILTFDEKIEIKNPLENISITPNLNYKPKIKAHKNTLEIILNKDSLKTNTTYSINFGSSIADINEGNILENFNYNFSTGSFLDTLIASGVALSIKDNKPVINAIISLKNSLSFVTYSSVTDRNGFWKINNMATGNYDLLIFKDNNSNKKLDNTELYFNQNIFITDSLTLFKNKLINYSFWAPKPLKIINAKYLDNYSFCLTMSKPPANIADIKYSINNTNYKKEKSLTATYKKDSFILYHSFIENDSILLSIQTDTLQKITIVQPKKRKKDKQSFSALSSVIGKKDPIVIKTIVPVKLTNSEKIKVNGSNKGFDLKIITPYKISLTHNQIIDKQIIFEQGAISDINGDDNNPDTLNISIAEDEKTGSYEFVIKDSINNYKGNVICKITNEISDYIIKTSVNKSNSMKGLLPGNCTLEVWFDENNNDKWDEGNYEQKIFPEKILLLKNFITIKPNWDTNGVEIYMD